MPPATDPSVAPVQQGAAVSPIGRPGVDQAAVDQAAIDQATIDQATVDQAAVDGLRAEVERTHSEAERAVLLHELGVAEERNGDDAAAARDLLGAINAAPDFREPLEDLVVLTERRKSYKNLGKLIERLAKISDEPGELTRVLTLLAAFHADVQEDLDAARSSLEEALDADQENAAAWLWLEIVAAQLGDADLRAHCVAARASLATHPAWQALLHIDHARLRMATGEEEAAVLAIETAVQLEGPATFLALLVMDEVGARFGRADLAARALEAQAVLIGRCIEDPSAAERLGVPPHLRSQGGAVDAWLRAADATQRAGDLPAARALLERAAATLPDAPVLLLAMTRSAEAEGDASATAELARRALAAGLSGPLAASLSLRVCEAAATTGDLAAATEALERALEQDPACLPARALQLDLLSASGQTTALVAALTTIADQAKTKAGRIRCLLAAAELSARTSDTNEAARALLTQAAALGAPPALLGQVERWLAAVTGDAPWYESATRELLAKPSSEAEHASLLVELSRLGLLRGDVEAVEGLAAQLARHAEARWLAHALRAFVLPLVSPAGSSSGGPSLAALATLEPEPERARALGVLLALQAKLAGDAPGAIRRLRELHGQNTSDLVTAEVLASMLVGASLPARAAEVLAATAPRVTDPALATAMHLQAGLWTWHSGERGAALQHFEAAAARSSSAAGPLLAWALRGAQPDDPAARRRALDAAAAAGADAPVLALERFALEASLKDSKDAATHVLDEAPTPNEADTRLGLELARAIWAPAAGRGAERREALERIAELAPAAAGVANAASHAIFLAEARRAGALDPGSLLESAARWAAVDAAPEAAIEELGAALGLGERTRDAGLIREVASRLHESLREPLHASAQLIEYLATEGGDVALVDGESPVVAASNLEVSPASSPPLRRAEALLAARSTLDEDSSLAATLLAGWNQLAGGDTEGATFSFREALESSPEELAAWDGLRAVAEATNDPSLLAESSAALGDLVADDELAAELWEAAAQTLIDVLGDTQRGELALRRAVERDVGRFSSFDRLFRTVRARNDADGLLELASARLTVATEPEERGKLHWERARVLRQSGNTTGALEELARVTEIEPDHVGALALAGEIHIAAGHFDEGAAKLAALARLEAAPAKQRLMSGTAAADLYERKLEAPRAALEVLSRMLADGLNTPAIQERLARTAALVGDWSQATQALEHLMQVRDTPAGRVEAARLALSIYRDRMGQPALAGNAAARLLVEHATDGEALDLVLSGALDRTSTRRLLESGAQALLRQLSSQPLDREPLSRLAAIAETLGDLALAQAAAGAALTLGDSSPGTAGKLAAFEQRQVKVPTLAATVELLDKLRAPEDGGPGTAVLALLAPTVAQYLGPTLEALGVGKRERVKPAAGLPLRDEVMAWAGALGIGELDVYVGGNGRGLLAIPGETPSLVITAEVTSPLNPAHRQRLARELLALRTGTSVLGHRSPTDVAALVLAACKLVEVEVPWPTYAISAEFERMLSKGLPRKAKKQLAELAPALRGLGSDPLPWIRGASATLDRMAAIAVGDVSWVLADASGATRGELGPAPEQRSRAAQLIPFALSPAFAAFRGALGLGLR